MSKWCKTEKKNSQTLNASQQLFCERERNLAENSQHSPLCPSAQKFFKSPSGEVSASVQIVEGIDGCECMFIWCVFTKVTV